LETPGSARWENFSIAKPPFFGTFENFSTAEVFAGTLPFRGCSCFGISDRGTLESQDMLADFNFVPDRKIYQEILYIKANSLLQQVWKNGSRFNF